MAATPLSGGGGAAVMTTVNEIDPKMSRKKQNSSLEQHNFKSARATKLNDPNRKACITSMCYDFSDKETLLNNTSIREALGVGDL
ncbi:hypothetical protein Tco_1287118 [Tanacetum coccineum]